MRLTRGGRLFCYLILALLLSPAAGGGGGRHAKCDPSKLELQCNKYERCVQDWHGPTEGHCECQRGYKYDGYEQCVLAASTVADDTNTVAPDVDDSSSGGGGGSSLAAGLLIPTFVASAILLFFCARRYQWLQRLRQYRNRYGNVLVTRDDDDDDVPPIP